MNRELSLPNPILDNKEQRTIEEYTKKYDNFIKGGLIDNCCKEIKTRVKEVLPEVAVTKYEDMMQNLTEKDFYTAFMKIVAEGFELIEQKAARYAVNPDFILKSIQKYEPGINTIDEICLARGYNIRKVLEKNNNFDLALAALQGGICGIAGFAGLPLNIVLSMFVYFRAVQSIAVYYGYDVKENPEELVFASEVLMMAMSPAREEGEQALAGVIGKMLVMAKGEVLKDALKKKTLKEMAEAGGAQLIYVQIRALAHKAAKNALNSAGKKGLEKSIFSDVLQQLGKRLPKNVARKSIPVLGGILGACFDTATMNNILKFAEICYHKRFLVEKEMRINEITDNGGFIYDVEYE